MASSKIKSGIFLFSGIGGGVFGLKHLLSPEKTIAPPSGVTGDFLDSSYQTGTGEHIYYDETREDYGDPNDSSWSLPQTEIDLEGSNNSTPKEFWEIYAEEVNYTEQEKEKNRIDAKRNLEKLNDYTFKVFGPCGWGTGWILDYQIPEGDKYPTVWYIATNAHVAWRFRFSTNDYNQILPIRHENTNYLRTRGKRASEYPAVKASTTEVRNKCYAVDTMGYFDMNLSQQDNGKERNADVGAIALGEMEEPKLFFSAFNYLDRSVNKDVKGNHYSDFVVLEVKFTSEEHARKTTNNFAKKYSHDNAINMFGKPLERKYKSKEEMWKTKDNFYLLAYPKGAKDKWVYTTNYHDETTIAAHLMWDASHYEFEANKNKWRSLMKGEEVSGKGLRWQGEVYKEVGHYWTLKYNQLGPGSSGGLYIDGEENAIGVTGNIATGWQIEWTIPLRSAGIPESEAGFRSPKYDLILGTDGQRLSYKSQVDTYLKPKGIKTWLSTREGWDTKVV